MKFVCAENVEQEVVRLLRFAEAPVLPIAAFQEEAVQSFNCSARRRQREFVGVHLAHQIKGLAAHLLRHTNGPRRDVP